MNLSAAGISAQATLDYHHEKHEYKQVADNTQSVHIAQGNVYIYNIYIYIYIHTLLYYST